MKIARFKDCDGERIGIVEGSEIADVTAGLPALSKDVNTWIQSGPRGWTVLECLAREAPRISLHAVDLLPPVKPSKILAIGGNYASHIEKIAHLGIPIGNHQIWFSKQVSCLTGGFAAIVMPRVSSCLDFEAELGVVIGRRCRHVKAADAAAYVAGYTVCNDASIRDWQMRTPTLMLGKSFETMGPVGPWFVTADEIPDPGQLRIRAWVNGDLRQDGNTTEMRYDVGAQIEELSTVMTLEPGDLILTGSPAGTGIESRPPRYLKVGDVVRIEIDNIGAIENRVIAEG